MDAGDDVALVIGGPDGLAPELKAGAAIGLAGWRQAWKGSAVLALSALAALGALPFLLPAL